MWSQEPSGRVRTPLEPYVLAATVLLIPVLIVQADVKSGPWLTAANVINWAVWCVFLVEAITILVVAGRKRAALRAHWLDVSLLIFTIPPFGAFLSGLRLVRLARLLRLLRAAAILSRALQAERSLTSKTAFRFAALITLFIVVIAGAAQATFDSHDFPSVWDGVWWSVVTVTTVGYGDIVPHTVPGRLIGILVMLLGIGFLSVLTATVASYFVKSDSDVPDLLAALARIEAELAELKARLPA
jgi:voltage-gated potassium channel